MQRLVADLLAYSRVGSQGRPLAPTDSGPGADAVILDLKLPKVDGLEVLRKLRKIRRLEHLPVIILTSSFRDPDIVEGYGLGATTYFVKPVEAEEFADAMARLARTLHDVVQRRPGNDDAREPQRASKTN